MNNIRSNESNMILNWQNLDKRSRVSNSLSPRFGLEKDSIRDKIDDQIYSDMNINS